VEAGLDLARGQALIGAGRSPQTVACSHVPVRLPLRRTKLRRNRRARQGV